MAATKTSNNQVKMDMKKLQKIVGRAVLDTKFRGQLLDPAMNDAALAEYKLNSDEQKYLSDLSLTREIALIFDQRITPTTPCGFMPRPTGSIG